MLRGLAVNADVQAGHAEVGDRARERRLDLERAAVRVDGLLGVAAVRERRAEAVPQEVVLQVSSEQNKLAVPANISNHTRRQRQYSRQAAR